MSDVIYSQAGGPTHELQHSKNRLSTHNNNDSAVLDFNASASAIAPRSPIAFSDTLNKGKSHKLFFKRVTTLSDPLTLTAPVRSCCTTLLPMLRCHCRQCRCKKCYKECQIVLNPITVGRT